MSINIEPRRFDDFPDEKLAVGLGLNTGNLLFSSVLPRHLDAEVVHVGFQFDPYEIHSDYDGLLVPAANWVNAREDWGELAERLEKADVLTVLVGLGAQATSIAEIPPVPAGTLRLLRAVADRSAMISVRGEFTAEVLKQLGFRDVVPTGCPSLFWHADREFSVPAPSDPKRLVLHGTRYSIHDSRLDDPQRWLYSESLRLRAALVLQSETPELLLLLRRVPVPESEARSRLVEWYRAADWPELESHLGSRAVAEIDVGRWIEAMASSDLSVGSRLHATIACLLAGVPGVLLHHDSRTREVAELASIPTLPLAEVDTKRHLDVAAMAARADPTGFNARYPALYDEYAGFLARNGLPHRL